MTPIDFSEANKIIAENQPPYKPLRAHVTVEGEVISCWKPGFIDKMRLLFGGCVWLHIHTFNRPLQPLAMQTKYPFEKRMFEKKS